MIGKERSCLNPECESIIQYFENPKKLFCTISCKNRYHYLWDKEKNQEIYELEKELKINYEIADNFILHKIYKVDAKVAKAIGFNKNIYMDIKQYLPNEKLYRSLRRIKDIYYRYDIKEDVIVFYKFEIEIN